MSALPVTAPSPSSGDGEVVDFRVMGGAARVLVCGGAPGLAGRAAERLAGIETIWSRFRPDSEVSRLTAAGGRPVVVSPETARLVATACAAWEATAGRYDPTVGAAVAQVGYDRSFELVEPDGDAAETPGPSPGCRGIEVDVDTCVVRIPAGVRFDPGGIGKGLAGDLVVAELRQAGAAGVLVDLGGDIRVAGEAPGGGLWSIAVDDPFRPGGHLLVVGLADGAVATSGRLVRHWRRGGRDLHHVVDPATGWPARTRLVAATAVAATGWWAEAVATTAFLDGPESLGRLLGASVIAIDVDGGVHATPDLEALR